MNLFLTLRRRVILYLITISGLSVSFLSDSQSKVTLLEEESIGLLEQYCFDCHDEETKKGNLDLSDLLDDKGHDGSLIFENLITGRMPPADKKQPSSTQRRTLLDWLSKRQNPKAINSYQRISRHEFVHSLNDLLGVKLDLTGNIPEDRGTHDFDSDRKILLTKEMLSSYFSAADEMLEFALPEKGFPQERIWVTNKIKDSHDTYNIYTRNYQEGILFSWTRANNGNNYSFFYDNFDPPVKGWYELTFDAKKLGKFEEDINVLVFSGKYYFADDRPQPQRLLDVISLSNKEVKSHTIRVFLHPGENVSVHCYSKHTFRKKEGDQGAYIKQLKARGPLFDNWPPRTYQELFKGLDMNFPSRKPIETSTFQTKLKAIGGSLSVSSYQISMEKEKMQDGSNRTFWHSQFNPTVAKPPHFVVLKNPAKKEINGLSYSKWSGGNGNGQVKSYSIYLSDDAQSWGDPILEGKVDITRSYEQPILFPKKTRKKYIKFLVTDAVSLDGKSIASIGKLDVITSLPQAISTSEISLLSRSKKDLKKVIRHFAERAFSSNMTEDELAPYYEVSLNSFKGHGDFVMAAKAGFKAVICSHRFLLAPGEHSNKSYEIASDLSRILWLSVPDQELLNLSRTKKFTTQTLTEQINRMLKDEKSLRMIDSFCSQWLNLRSFNKVNPSLKLYPNYNDLLNHYLPIETEKYLNHLIQENLPISYLIDSDFSFLNQRLAQHYGIDGIIGQKMRKVSFSPEAPRGGILTMGSVLKVTADGFDTSPILRGAWVSKNIAGNTLSPPPENVKAIEPEHGQATTLREQIEQHKENKTCYACHKSIDPYGFALENFDATGQWRTKYRVKKPHNGTFQFRLEGYYHLGGEVDASGEIATHKFNDVFGLKKILLSDHRKVAYNFTKKFFEYANGYKPDLKERLHLFKLIPENAKECRIKDLITKVLLYSLREEKE